jgi:hypothetical protein
MFVQPRRPYLAEKHSEARRMRSEGGSIKAIAADLGVSVSSVSVWVRDIKLTAAQRAINQSRGRSARRDAWRTLNRQKRLRYQQEGRLRARRREPLHLAGCMLYWCEGAKCRNTARLVNSDLGMVIHFKSFATECFELPPSRFTVTLNVYLGNGLPIEAIETHWLDSLELPRTCLRKHQINHFPTSSSGKKSNKLPYGVCSLRITKSTPIVQHIYGAIQEYAGFEEPRWLDGCY